MDLTDAFAKMDADKSGSISREEFHNAVLHDEFVIDLMEKLGVDPIEEDLFTKLDADLSDEIGFNEFMQGTMLIMQGNEPARAKDLIRTLLLSESTLHRIKDIVGRLDELDDVFASVSIGTSAATPGMKLGE